MVVILNLTYTCTYQGTCSWCSAVEPILPFTPTAHEIPPPSRHAHQVISYPSEEREDGPKNSGPAKHDSDNIKANIYSLWPSIPSYPLRKVTRPASPLKKAFTKCIKSYISLPRISVQLLLPSTSF